MDSIFSFSREVNFNLHFDVQNSKPSPDYFPLGTFAGQPQDEQNSVKKIVPCFIQKDVHLINFLIR